MLHGSAAATPAAAADMHVYYDQDLQRWEHVDFCGRGVLNWVTFRRREVKL